VIPSTPKTAGNDGQSAGRRFNPDRRLHEKHNQHKKMNAVSPSGDSAVFRINCVYIHLYIHPPLRRSCPFLVHVRGITAR